MKKDYFSSHSKIYAAFRPVYPKELYDFVFSQVKERRIAWDCGTGNGQVANVLSHHFDKVFATDISQQQLDEAFQASNIHYSIASAESTSFESGIFDLVTAAQALHWFKAEEFYKEVQRTSNTDGIVAVWGYGMLNVNPEVDRLFLRFYHDTVGAYWDEARRHVEQGYESIPFPFATVKAPRTFCIETDWTAEHFAGYLTSWSATQKFIKDKGFDPVPDFMEQVNQHWRNHQTKRVVFPIFLKVGRVYG